MRGDRRHSASFEGFEANVGAAGAGSTACALTPTASQFLQKILHVMLSVLCGIGTGIVGLARTGPVRPFSGRTASVEATALAVRLVLSTPF